VKHAILAAAGALAFVSAGCGSPQDTSSSLLVINEVLSSNTVGCADEAGEQDDWIELHNPTSDAIDPAGYAVSDDDDVPRKAVLPAGLVVPAGGFLLLWADDAPEQGAAHLPFKLNAGGEQLALRDAAGALVDRASWGGTATDVSLARFPDGTGDFASCAVPTCATANGEACPD
jgi:hypothetical protein